MAATDLASSTLAAGSKIGRSFSVVTLLPALFFVLAMWALAVSGALMGKPDAHAFLKVVTQPTLGGVAALVVVAFVLAYVLHPVQFAVTQLLEGYWGTSAFGRRLMAQRIKHHRRRRRSLRIGRAEASNDLNGMTTAAKNGPQGDVSAVPLLVAFQQYDKALVDFPDDAGRIMPTRLGNVLRRFEDGAGGPYGLDGIAVVPPLSTVAGAARVAYLTETREQLDGTVSICGLSLIATVVYAGALVTDGWWLLLALVPYCLGYVAYRGAVQAAREYGLALKTLIDIDRFALYEALHLPLPRDSQEELILSEVVSNAMVGKPFQTRYIHSTQGAGSGARSRSATGRPRATGR